MMRFFNFKIVDLFVSLNPFFIKQYTFVFYLKKEQSQSTQYVQFHYNKNSTLLHDFYSFTQTTRKRTKERQRFFVLLLNNSQFSCV